MNTIPLAEYAKRHMKTIAAVRQMVQRGGLQTARKEGREWVIDGDEPYPDRRVKSGRYRNWRKK